MEQHLGSLDASAEKTQGPVDYQPLVFMPFSVENTNSGDQDMEKAPALTHRFVVLCELWCYTGLTLGSLLSNMLF